MPRTAGAMRELFRPPPSGPIEQDHLDGGLRTRAARGAAATLAAQWLQLLLKVGSTAVLARLLTPGDFGMVAMVTAAIGFGDALWNMGLATATVQSRRITAAHVNFFFWLQSCLGLVITVITILCAPALAGFYDDPNLSTVTIALSFSFLFGGLTAQHLALLSRQMRFALLSVIDVISLTASVVVAVVVAALGGTYWAIVAMTLLTPAVRMVLCWSASGWRPTRPTRPAEVAGMLRFGGNLAVTNTLDYAALNVDNLIIGRMFGSAALGLYSRAYSLLLLPLWQIHYPVARVAVPVLSYLQTTPERYRRYYRTAVSGVAYVAFPLIALLGALAHEVVAVLLGPGWSGAVPIFQVLAIGGALTTLRDPNGWVFVSTGHTGRQAVWALLNRPVIILGFVIGARWGVVGVAWGFVGAHAVLLIPSFLFAMKDTPLRLRDVALANWRPALVGCSALLVGLAAHQAFGSTPLLAIGAAGLGLAVVLAVELLVWGGVRADVRELRDALLTPPGAAAEDDADLQLRPRDVTAA